MPFGDNDTCFQHRQADVEGLRQLQVAAYVYGSQNCFLLWDFVVLLQRFKGTVRKTGIRSNAFHRQAIKLVNKNLLNI